MEFSRQEYWNGYLFPSGRPSWSRDQMWVSYTAGRFFTIWATREAQGSPSRACSVQFSHSVVCDSLWPHGLQHTRHPCPSPTPRVYPNSYPLSWWCHPNLILCCPLPLPPSIFPSTFSNKPALHIRWPTYWSFSFSISPSNEYSRLISFRGMLKVKVKSLRHVRLCDSVDCSLSGSSVHGIFQARVLEWIAISFSRGSPQPRNQTLVFLIAGRRFTVWVTREAC